MKYTILKVTMENDEVHYKLKLTKWHWIRCVIRHFTGPDNLPFREDYSTYNNALAAIDSITEREKRESKRKKESFVVYRTDIPSHIPEIQRLKYISTPKKGDL